MERITRMVDHPAPSIVHREPRFQQDQWGVLRTAGERLPCGALVRITLIPFDGFGADGAPHYRYGLTGLCPRTGTDSAAEEDLQPAPVPGT